MKRGTIGTVSSNRILLETARGVGDVGRGAFCGAFCSVALESRPITCDRAMLGVAALASCKALASSSAEW